MGLQQRVEVVWGEEDLTKYDVVILSPGHACVSPGVPARLLPLPGGLPDVLRIVAAGDKVGCFIAATPEGGGELLSYLCGGNTDEKGKARHRW